MIVDYHIHTKASDGKGSMKDYVKSAQEKGINEIGFSDHVDKKDLHDWTDFLGRVMPKYVKDFQVFREKSVIPVKLGIEVDFFPDETESIQELVASFPFDYVIGSVHVIDKWVIDHPAQQEEHLKRDPCRSYKEYFGLVREMCATGPFDIVGHPDLIKIFGLKPDKDMQDFYLTTARAIAKRGMCAEINARGLVRPCREIYPSLQFLTILRENDVPVTFGSDAHEPCELGENLDEAVMLARKAGYSEACTFNRRQKAFFRI